MSNENLELKRRITVLYTNHYTWLLQCSKNITKNNLEAEDLIGDLMIYLLEKGTPKIYYADGINTMYAYRYLQTRWINKVVKQNKIRFYKYNEVNEMADIPYDMESDTRMMEAFESVQEELKRLSTTRDWSKSKLFEMYYGSEDTMIDIANKIGICKSTTFTNIKKIREHLKNTCPNPFQNV